MKKFNELSKRQKLFILPIFGLLLLGGAFATTGYVVNHIKIQSDVYEPFSEIEYAIVGDAGNWNGQDTCAGLPEESWESYSDGQLVYVGGLYAGEGRKFCIRITNEAEADIDYTIESEVITGCGNYDKCVDAFGEHTLTGTVPSENIKIDGLGIVVSQDAEPVDDCKISVTVSRG